MTNHLDMYLFIQMSYSVNHLYKHDEPLIQNKQLTKIK